MIGLKDATHIKEMAKFFINIPSKVAVDRLGSERSQMEPLSLSLEDNSTITGTISILKEFSKDFNLPECHSEQEYVPLDKVKMCFDVKTAELKLS